MIISERLKQIAELVHEGANVYDVGADHGLVEKYLLDFCNVNSVVAVENKPGPCNILKNNLTDYDVKILLCDGLEGLSENEDTIIIAGMGGLLIKEILEKGKNKLDKVNQIVVDAHRDQETVRRYITGLGFIIEKEVLVKEKEVFYNIISFKKGESKNYKDVELEFGYNISKSKYFEEYKKYLLDKAVKELAAMKKSSNTKVETIKNQENKIERIKSLWIQSNF